MTPKELREFATQEIMQNHELLDASPDGFYPREQLLRKRIEAYKHILSTVQDDDDAPCNQWVTVIKTEETVVGQIGEKRI